MLVSRILRDKGNHVALISSQHTVHQALAMLAEHDYGALVVSDDDTSIAGIISERDIARALAADGAQCLDRLVGQLMTSDVRTCRVEDTIEHVMETMTDGRFRHLPVVENGALVGLVSIGDAVKHRMSELEAENTDMVAYIQGR